MKIIKLLIGAVGLLIVLGGCSTTKPQHAENSKTQIPPGRWMAVGRVKNVNDFKTLENIPEPSTEIISYKDGKIAKLNDAFYIKPENGWISTADGSKKFKYFLKNINGNEYFFYPVFNMDSVVMNRDPWYIVYQKEITMTEVQLRETNFLKFSKIDKAQKLSTGQGVKVAIMDWLFDMSPEYQKLYVDPISLVPGSKLGDEKPWHGKWMVDFVHQVAPDAKIIPIKVVVGVKGDNSQKAHFLAYQKYVEEGIRYAADHGATVVTTSVGSVQNTPGLLEAVKYAENKGCIFVDVEPEYKTWNGDQVIYSQKDELSKLIIHAGAYPQFEFPFVELKDQRDIFTWGYQIKPTFKNGYGPSNAPPIIGGVIALIKSANPELTPEQIRNIIYSTGMFINGYKVLNAEAAVQKAIGLKE